MAQAAVVDAVRVAVAEDEVEVESRHEQALDTRDDRPVSSPVAQARAAKDGIEAGA